MPDTPPTWEETTAVEPTWDETKPSDFKDLSAGQALKLVTPTVTPLQTATQGGGRAPLASYAETATSALSDLSESPVSRFVAPRPSLTEPRVSLPKPTVKPSDSFLGAAGKEAIAAVEGLPEFLTSDAGILTALAGPIAPRLIAAGYSADMIHDAYRQAKELGNWSKMTPSQKGKAVVDLLATSALALITGKAGIGKTETAIPRPETPAVVAENRPAVKLMPDETGAQEKLPAEPKPEGQWETHNEIIKREGVKPEDIDRRIFVDSQGNEKPREQTAQELTAAGTPPEIPGQGHSTDVNKAAEEAKVSPVPEAPKEEAAPSISGLPKGALFQGVRPENLKGEQGKSNWLTDDLKLAGFFQKRIGESGTGRIDVYDPKDLPPLEDMLEKERSKPGSNVYSFTGLRKVQPIGEIVLENGKPVFKPSKVSPPSAPPVETPPAAPKHQRTISSFNEDEWGDLVEGLIEASDNYTRYGEGARGRGGIDYEIDDALDAFVEAARKDHGNLTVYDAFQKFRKISDLPPSMLRKILNMLQDEGLAPKRGTKTPLVQPAQGIPPAVPAAAKAEPATPPTPAVPAEPAIVKATTEAKPAETPATAAAKVTPKAPYQVSFESPAGGRETVTVSRVKFDQLPDQMKKLVENEMYHASQFEEWKDYAKWEKVKQGKTAITLWEKKAGTEVSHNISLESPEEEFKRWATREDLYDKEFNPAGQSLRDKLISEREAAEKANQEKEIAERAAIEKQMAAFHEYEQEISKVKLPTGKKTTITIENKEGEKSQLSGTAYGPWMIDKRTGGKGRYAQPTVYKVTHIPSGLGISGDGLTSLEQAKNYVRALIHSEVRSDWKTPKDLSKAEHQAILEVARAWAAGGEVPKYFKAEPQGLAKNIRAKLDAGEKLGGEAGGGELHQMIYDFGRSIYQKGMEFAEWSSRMVKELGDQLSKAGTYLRDLWERITGTAPSPESLEGVRRMTPEQYFETASAWSKRGLAREGTGPQLTAEAAARANPDRPAWEKARDEAAAEAKRLLDEVRGNPKALITRQKEISGAAMKKQFFSEGLKELDKPTASLVHAPLSQVEAGAGISLSGVTDAVKAAAEYVKSLTKEEMRAPKMTDRRRAVLNWSAKLQRSFGEAAAKQKDIIKRVSNPIRREGITNWIQADGDVTVLASRRADTEAWRDPTTGKPHPDAKRLVAGYDAALHLTPEELAVANEIKADYARFAARGQAADVLKDLKDNYVTQSWNLGKGPGGPGVGRTLKEKFRFSRASTFPTFFDGEQAGYSPKTKDIAKLLPMYSHEMNSVIAARELVSEMAGGVASDGRPLLAPKGIGIPVESEEGGKATLVLPKVGKEEVSDYKVLANQPALSGWKWVSKDSAGNPVFLKADLALHPEAFNHFRSILGRSAIREWYSTRTTALAELPKALAKGIDMANSETKRTMLGMLATFHQIQTGTHAVGHRVNPTFNIPKIDLVRNTAQMDAAKHGLMLLPDKASENQFMEGFRTSGLISKIPGLGPIADWYSNYLFTEYIPGLKFKTYEAILNRNMKVYARDLAAGTVKAEDVKVLSSEQANAAYGHINYADLGRNPTMQHIAQLGLLAPDFLEARGRFAGQAIKGLTGAKVGREQLLALATLAIAQVTLAYTTAKITGGDWDKKRPFEFTYGNRRYTMRSVPEDLQNLVTKTRQFIHSRLSPLVGKGAVQYLTGVDYRGRKVSAGQTTKELATQPIPLTIRGFTGLGNTTLSGMEQLAGSLGLRISRYSPIMDIHDLVTDFKKTSDDPKLRSDIEFQEKQVFASPYEKLRNTLHNGDPQQIRSDLRNLIQTGHTPQQIENALKPWTGEARTPKPFTGSKKTEAQFLRTLTSDQRATYRKALLERAREYQNFQRALAPNP